MSSATQTLEMKLKLSCKTQGHALFLNNQQIVLPLFHNVSLSSIAHIHIDVKESKYLYLDLLASI